MGFLKDWRISQKSGDSDRMLMSQRAITGLVNSKALPDGGEAGNILKISDDLKPVWGNAGGAEKLYNTFVRCFDSAQGYDFNFQFVTSDVLTSKNDIVAYLKRVKPNYLPVNGYATTNKYLCSNVQFADNVMTLFYLTAPGSLGNLTAAYSQITYVKQCEV